MNPQPSVLETDALPLELLAYCFLSKPSTSLLSAAVTHDSQLTTLLHLFVRRMLPAMPAILFPLEFPRRLTLVPHGAVIPVFAFRTR